MEDLAAFEAHMARYEQGLAYRKITEQMGPSAQLIAFVNYDRVTPESLGLESFNIMSDHQTILAEIDGDPALAMATEALADRVRKAADFMMKAGAVVFVVSLIGGPLGGLGFSALMAGAITKKVAGIKTKVYSLNTFNMIKAHFNQCLEYDLDFANHIPTDFSPKAWSEFREDHASPKTVGKYAPTHDQVPFDRSGWNEGDLSNAVKWLRDSAEKLSNLQKNFGGKLQKIDTWVTKDHGGDREATETMKHIAATVGLSQSLFVNSVKVLDEARDVLNSVANRFEESKKD